MRHSSCQGLSSPSDPWVLDVHLLMARYTFVTGLGQYTFVTGAWEEMLCWHIQLTM